MYSQTNLSFPVFQEQPPGLVVYEVFATDEDEGVNGEVRYSFLQTGAGNRDWENFRIDAITGVITTAVKLDREKQALYSVSVTAPTLPLVLLNEDNKLTSQSLRVPRITRELKHALS